MTNLLIRLFVKDWKNYEQKEVRDRYGIFAGMIGILSNLILFLAKILIGLFSGSISIMADATNNLSDSASSLITIFGFFYAKKPADKEHPYGHARIEYISGLFVTILILFVGFQFLQSSIQKILNPESIVLSPIMLIILLLSILVKLWQSHFNKNIGSKIQSSTLLATAKDSLNDVLITSTVLASALIEYLTGWLLDGYVGLFVAGFILYSGIKMIKEIIDELLGMIPDEELIQKIKDKINTYDGILGYHDLMVHTYGPTAIYATVHVEVSAKQDILKSHDVIDQIEQDFLTDLNIHLLIHLDPVDLSDQKALECEEKIQSVIQKIDLKLSFHDFRMIHHKTRKKIVFDLVVPEDFELSDKELSNEVKNRIQEVYPELEIDIKLDHNYLLE